MNRHKFILPKESPMPDVAPNWIGFICQFCGEISGLDAWQIRDMPREMAKCEKSTIRAKLFECLSESINCF